MHIDDTVRDYLLPIAASRLRGMTLPGPLQRANEQLALLITTGFLPQRFRDEMQLPWDADKQRQFDRLMGVIRGSTTCCRNSCAASRSMCCCGTSTGVSAPAARWCSDRVN